MEPAIETNVVSDGKPTLSVIKLGGSLLEMDGLPTVLRRWLSSQRTGWQVIVVGGGAMADYIRAVHRRHALGDVAAHRLAIEAMALNTHILSALLMDVPLISRAPTSQTPANSGRTLLLDAGRFLDEIEPALPGDPLPASWDVTSDSIAARLAAAWSADELVLLKSSLPPTGASLKQLSEAGYVDRFFPIAAAKVPIVRCVNLRDEGFPVWVHS